MVLNLSQSQPTIPICVVTPYLPTVSETFIRGHIEQLPANVSLVHGWPPSLLDGPVLSLPTRLAYKLRRTFLGNKAPSGTTAAYIAAFRRFKTRVVLAEYGTTGALVMEACARLGIPLVVHFHGYDASMHEVLKQNSKTYPLMFQQACAIIAVSRAMERKLHALGAPQQKVHYNPYGIDCDKFTGADPSSAPPVFLAVGRFVEKKAPHLTIEAFAQLQRDFPDARLRMIGDGPLFESSQQRARELNVDRVVTFLGAQAHDVVRNEMRAARCFVQHSIEAANGDCEGTPVGILEASACGLPIVSTRHAGIPDVVIHGQTGFLTEERDVSGMARQMIQLMKHPELAGQMGRAAGQHIRDNFSQAISLGRLWSIIESCIEA